MKRMVKRIVMVAGALVLVALVFPGGAFAQSERSHWGVTFSAAPSWTSHSAFKLLYDAEATSVRGTDLEIGIARGRDRGGEWGVSYFRRALTDTSRVDKALPQQSCWAKYCGTSGTFLYARSAVMNGIEAYKFIPFGGAIAGRVQIGMTVGGGVVKVEGNAERHELSPNWLVSRGTVVGVTQQEVVTTVPARQLFVSDLQTLPVFKLEAAVAVLVAPGLKVRVGGGFNFPSAPGVSVSMRYLIGETRR